MTPTTESGRPPFPVVTEQTSRGSGLVTDVTPDEPRDGADRLHPVLAQRWSPTQFDATHEVSPAQVEVLLDAARWAPSAGNSQPWAFVVGRRGDDTHTRLVQQLTGSSRAWAPGASLLLANLAHELVEDTDWAYSEFAAYDLGQAVAHLSVQAQAMGLAVRQFRAFDRDGVAREFAVPGHWTVMTMAAVGRPAPGPPHDRDRRPLDDLRWPPAP